MVTFEELERMPRAEAEQAVARVKGSALRALARAAGVPLGRSAADVRRAIVACAQLRVEHVALREGIPVEEARRRIYGA